MVPLLQLLLLEPQAMYLQLPQGSILLNLGTPILQLVHAHPAHPM
jgi:hypothetical protein